MSNALDRLHAAMQESNNKQQYTIEEQLEAANASTDDFITSMSEDAKQELTDIVAPALPDLFEEVTLDEPEEETTEDIPEELPSSIFPIDEPIDTPIEDTSESNIVVQEEQNVQNDIKIEQNEPEIAQKVVHEELFNNNIRQNENKLSHRGRKKREEAVVTNEQNNNTSLMFSQDKMKSIFNHLAKEILDDLQKRGYKLSSMDAETMKVILNYMKQKF